ncbi:LemA family protein [Roseococcus sp. SYP-B2431]|uniref:LemA family protein n=1 Tax=Roseococcus sp. SYP-B2431 TaxID=2496640 RepID=UPI0013F43A17|nr:LemA family protein [Roseococcus sp. SYP-B2431]
MEWVIPAVVLLLLIWAVFVRGRLVALQQAAVQAWADLDEPLRRRHELVSRLVAAVPGRTAREKKSLDGLTNARRHAAAEQEPPAIGKAEAELSAAIGRAFEAVEQDPDLSVDPGLGRLQAELSDLQGRIGRSARAFNEAARAYNEARTGFPGGFLAYVVRFDLLQYYTVAEAKPEAARTAPARV